MFVNLDRGEFVALLNKLGSESDADVLAAARDLHAKVTVAGLSWDQLLAPERGDDDEDDDAVAAAPAAGADDAVLVAPDADHSALDDAEKDEARKLIDAIGAMKVSDTTRDELADYAADLLEGRMEKMDLRYLRALHKRLNG